MNINNLNYRPPISYSELNDKPSETTFYSEYEKELIKKHQNYQKEQRMTIQEAIELLQLEIELNEKHIKTTRKEKMIDALNMAIEALQQDEIIRCEDCKHHGTSNCPMWGDDTTEDYMWCCDGERMESDTE